MKKIAVFILALLCLSSVALAADYEPVALNSEQAYALNLFLSNFTEVGMDRVDSYTDHDALAIFGHHHIWCNDYEAFEYGEYFDENNCRIPRERVLDTINRFFYYENGGAEYLNQDVFGEDDHYYYHCETGGWDNSGFAHALGVYPIGGDRYFVSFANFGSGTKWDNAVLDDELDAIIETYGVPAAYGSALVYAGNLADRGSYRMISYSLV